MASIASSSFEEKLTEVLRRTLPKLAPDVRARLAALITPEAIAIIAAVLVAWIVSHAFGVERRSTSFLASSAYCRSASLFFPGWMNCQALRNELIMLEAVPI